MDYATLSKKFDDGYEQMAENGLNGVAQPWNISISGTGTKIKETRNFFDRHVGAKLLLWTPPSGKLGFCRGIAPSISGGGGDYYTLTATLTQAYHP